MLKLTRLALMLVAFGSTGAVAEEIHPTPVMLAKAKQVFKDCAEPSPRCEYHFRNIGDSVWACAYHVGYNWGFCTQTPLSEVKKIDEVAEDLCRHSGPDAIIPHAMTGEADALNYECAGNHMRRKPYSNVFDIDGWIVDQWEAAELRE
jgi:hypothetical protein